MRVKITVFCVVGALWLLGCDRQKTPSSSAIDKAGTFPSPSGRRKLVISDSKGLVDFRIVDEQGAQLAGDSGASAYSRWFFCWDIDENLWMYSGDIGTFVYAFDANKKTYGKLLVTPNEPLFAKIPSSFKQKVPQSTKNAWKK